MSSAQVSINQQPMDVSADVDMPSEKRLSSADASWTIEDSEELYRINGCGEPYFSINAAGHVIVSPQGERGDRSIYISSFRHCRPVICRCLFLFVFLTF